MYNVCTVMRLLSTNAHFAENTAVWGTLLPKDADKGSAVTSVLSLFQSHTLVFHGN